MQWHHACGEEHFMHQRYFSTSIVTPESQSNANTYLHIGALQ
jgi:hypothetical protein